MGNVIRESFFPPSPNLSETCKTTNDAEPNRGGRRGSEGKELYGWIDW